MSSIANPQLDGMPKMAFALVSIALVSFSLYTAMFGVFPDMIQRCLLYTSPSPRD